jgi:hypothetical protein
VIPLSTFYARLRRIRAKFIALVVENFLDIPPEELFSLKLYPNLYPNPDQLE